ncbi:MAG: hypothetical protein ACOC9T_01280 [Myxococcota bacterium]
MVFEPQPRTPWDPGTDVSPPTSPDEELFCHPYSGFVADVGLWVDDRGVFVLADVVNAEGPTRGWPSGAVLQHHDGTEWEVWFDRPHDETSPGPSGLASQAGKPIYLWSEPDCWITSVRAQETTYCWLQEAPTTPGEYSLTDMHPTADGSWLLYTDPMETHLALVPGHSFTPDVHGTPLAVWGDGAGYYVLTSEALFLGGQNSGSTSAGPYEHTAFWASDRDNVWVGTDDGHLLNFTTAQWLTHEAVDGRIEHLSGTTAAEPVYFATRRRLGRLLPDGEIESLIAFESTAITIAALQVHEEDAVIAVRDDRHVQETCGQLFLVRYRNGVVERL